MYRIYDGERPTTEGHEDLVRAIEKAVNMAAWEVRHSKEKLSFDTANNQGVEVAFQTRIYRTRDNQIVQRIKVVREA